MPDLIAQGPQEHDRWRRSLVAGRGYVVGRQAGAWSTPWDKSISKRHAEICWLEDRLQVKRLDDARNPIFVRGRESDRFFIKPGDHFVIGETRFTLADEQVNLTEDQRIPLTERAFSTQQLKQIRFRNADQRIEVLSRLPDIIKGATSDQEMLIRVINVLLTGLPMADTVAIVSGGQAGDSPQILQWDRRRVSGGEFHPSQRLIQQALDNDRSVVHVWRGDGQDAKFTAGQGMDWAFCTPLPGAAGGGWALYASGAFHDPASGETASGEQGLHEEMKFAELVAAYLATLREVRLLARRHACLSQFFSPVVLESLALEDPDVALRPREADVAVLFCDLRGFSLSTEKSADDLQGLLERVSQALGVMTKHIHDTGGVVGDFHGDAAMGFWGWPLSSPDSIQRACRAALGIRRDFAKAAQQSDHVLTNFRMGIGIAAGRAVCGRLGAVDQVKVSVFGPVVVRASRLEGMTKFLRAPILLDEAAADAMRRTTESLADQVDPSSGQDDWFRLRRVARVIPYGMQSPVEITELLPTEDEYPQLTQQHIQAYEEALDDLLRGDWATAFQKLHQVPADDRVKDFLTMLIVQHNRTPPPDWKGVIPLTAK